MNRLESFQSHVTAALVAATTLLLGAVEDRAKVLLERLFKSAQTADTTWADTTWLALLFIVVVVSLHLFEAGAKGIAERSARLRRWIMGPEFVEGWWVDVSFAPGETVWNGGLLRIWYEGRRMRVEGETFDERGLRRGPFRSNFSTFDNQVLTWGYLKKLHDRIGGDSDGLSVYEFNAERPRPRSFDGKYFSSDGATMRLYGECVKPADAKQLTTPEERGAFVRGFIERHKRRSSSLLALPEAATRRP